MIIKPYACDSKNNLGTIQSRMLALRKTHLFKIYNIFTVSLGLYVLILALH